MGMAPDFGNYFGDISRRERGGLRTSDQTMSLRSWAEVRRGPAVWREALVEDWMPIAPPWPGMGPMEMIAS